MTDRHHHRTGNRFRSQLSAIARWLTESFRFHQSTYTQYVCVCVTAFIALYCWNGRSDYAIFGERTHTHFLLPNFYASESHWNWFHSFVFNVKKKYDLWIFRTTKMYHSFRFVHDKWMCLQAATQKLADSNIIRVAIWFLCIDSLAQRIKKIPKNVFNVIFSAWMNNFGIWAIDKSALALMENERKIGEKNTHTHIVVPSDLVNECEYWLTE